MDEEGEEELYQSLDVVQIVNCVFHCSVPPPAKRCQRDSLTLRGNNNSFNPILAKFPYKPTHNSSET